jgi:hypothetical protein
MRTVSLDQAFDLGLVAGVCAIREPTNSVINLFDSERQALPSPAQRRIGAWTCQTESVKGVSVERRGARLDLVFCRSLGWNDEVDGFACLQEHGLAAKDNPLRRPALDGRPLQVTRARNDLLVGMVLVEVLGSPLVRRSPAHAECCKNGAVALVSERNESAGGNETLSI